MELLIEGQAIKMQVDTGAAVSLMSERDMKRVLPKVQVKKTTIVLCTYTSEPIPVLGEAPVLVKYGETSRSC